MSIMDEWLKLENEAIEKQNEDDIELSSVEGETEKFVISRTLVLSTGINEEIKLKQGDHNSRVLRLDIQKDTTTFLKLNNASVFLVVQKPNGLKEKLQGTVVDALNGVVEFAFSREVLSTAGVAKCEVVRLGEDETVLSSPSFDITIEESIFNDFMLGFGEDEFTVIMKGEL